MSTSAVLASREDICIYAADDPLELVAALRQHPNRALGDRSDDDLQGECRLAIAAPNARSLAVAERVVREGKRWSGPNGIWFSPRPLAWDGGRLAFLFPGVEPAFLSATVDLDALAESCGMTAPPLPFDTVPAQSASVVRLGIHLNEIMGRLDVVPDDVAGHSMGESAAAVASGLVTSNDAATVLQTFDVAINSVSCSDIDYFVTNRSADVVAAAIADVAGIAGVTVSHDNCPRQSVICGPTGQMSAAIAALKQAGVRGAMLHFRSGFHSPALVPALPRVAELLSGVRFNRRQVPIWSPTTGGLLPSQPDAIREVMLRHFVEPVRFTPLIREMYEDGVRVFVHLGVGSLPSFVDDILIRRPHLAISLIDNTRSAIDQVRRSLSALWVDGVTTFPQGLALTA
jgi:acyl transferase domain-containing protein